MSNEDQKKQQDTGTGPVGKGNYVVKQGDCIESIAANRGLFWETIWNNPDNQQIRKEREDINVLLPGDRLFVPKIRLKDEDGATEQRHKFHKRGVPSELKLQFLDEDKRPRSNEPYVLEIEGQTFSGELDGDGCVKQKIPPNAKKGKIIIGQEDEKEEMELDIGAINPLKEVSGVQARLRNLGYKCGPVDGFYGQMTESAVKAFQKDNKLDGTGKIDKQTTDKLFELYDNKERKS